MTKKRILVVDDEKDFVEMIKFRLEANGYEVIAAFDGIQGMMVYMLKNYLSMPVKHRLENKNRGFNKKESISGRYGPNARKRKDE